MHPKEQQRLSDSSWFLQKWELVPEEFATHLLELGTLVLRRRLGCVNHKAPTPIGMFNNQPSA